MLATGTPQPRSYEIGDDEAFGVGLTCGGTIDVPVAPFAAATATATATTDRAWLRTWPRPSHAVNPPPSPPSSGTPSGSGRAPATEARPPCAS